MKAFLLAAGYATRMYPLTRDRPKPLLEVAGKPILSHVLDRVVALPEVREVIVIANSRFHDAFADWAAAQACRVPIRVLDDGSTSEEDKLGALGDLAFALEQVPLEGEDWLVVAGDNLLGFGLEALHGAFQALQRPLLAVRDVAGRGDPAAGANVEGGSRYNEVTLDADGRVVGFREKPPDPKTGLAAIALYFLPSSSAALLLRYLAAGGNRDAPGHFIAWLVGETEVHARPIHGTWFDIGSLAGLATAREVFGGGESRARE